MSRAIRRPVRWLGAAALAVVSLSLAPSAAASSSEYIAAPHGMTGVTETVTIKAPSQKNKKISIRVVDGFNISSTFHTTVTKHGYGSLLWTPQHSGLATITGLGSIEDISPLTVQVAAAPSYLTMSAPNTVQAGGAASVTIQLYKPVGVSYGNGQVMLNDASGNILAGGFLQYDAGGQESASIGWTPGAAGQLGIYASFLTMDRLPIGAPPTPTATSQVTVSADPVPVAIVSQASSATPLPLGTPTTLQAVLGAGYPDGSVTWSLDGTALTPPMTTSAGMSSFPWTPTVEGVRTLAVDYSAVAADGVTPVTGSSSLTFTVGPAITADALTVTPKGQAAWSPSRTITMDQSTKFTLTGKSQSGTTVVLSENGPCLITGAVLKAINTGTCYVTAMSPGNLAYSPGKQTYTVRVKGS